MDLKTKLKGFQDSRSLKGMLSRGKNIYSGTSNAAHKGGGHQYGRPDKLKAAINRRLARGNTR